MKKGFLISYCFLSAKLRIKSSYYWLREIETGIPLHFNLRQYSSSSFAASFLCGLKLFCKVKCVFYVLPTFFCFSRKKFLILLLLRMDTFSISVRLLFCHDGSVLKYNGPKAISNSHHNSLKFYVNCDFTWWLMT